ncbi:MAG TPA: methylated-DNA--[protein]-cysteine S-methyltransferase, partial [Acidimicrobiales bacterium]|nr:methylated-DNA--[protein]-cysteine S-methyltransferase [Acidimicrobiales bacterium]
VMTTMTIENRLADLYAPAPEALVARLVAEAESRRPGPQGVAQKPRAYFRIVGPSGDDLFVVSGEAGITHVFAAKLVGGSNAEFEARAPELCGGPVVEATRPPTGVTTALRTGNGRRLRYDLSELTEFGRKVLEKALEIPQGEVRPYSWIAREIGHPKAVRAVGTALGRNPVPVLIPCHRVVRNDGTIGKYALGTEMKRSLLGSEGVDIERLETMAANGMHLIGSDTTHIYCHPTCSHGKNLMERHRVEFRDAKDAAARGYRPCKSCRPEPISA